ncbi:polymorphic toxin type 37 domain-containing protein [Serratia liquefaciens]|uniref:polymorphic toxin type 37 domain-containing protein n=1 Tax=Serratia liquefaciens TaxID=614 RepID=UPI0036F20BF0
MDDGRGAGWVDKKDNVRVPTGLGSDAHGDPHWDVQIAWRKICECLSRRKKTLTHGYQDPLGSLFFEGRRASVL